MLHSFQNTTLPPSKPSSKVGQGLSAHFSHKQTEVQRGFLTCQNLTAIQSTKPKFADPQLFEASHHTQFKDPSNFHCNHTVSTLLEYTPSCASHFPFRAETPLFGRFSTFSKLTASVVAGGGIANLRVRRQAGWRGWGCNAAVLLSPLQISADGLHNGPSTTQCAALSRSDLAR